MAPAQLELFKFSLYVFCPVAAMLHYGDPEWYERWVGPLRSSFRRDEIKQVEPPRDSGELKAELQRLREERLARKAQSASPASAAEAQRQEAAAKFAGWDGESERKI
ncbi:Pet100p [Rhodotorula paludigena]|uniref:Pet100p n=1 Tax=Rhodotorula paludigena TaxID=86838 RepID=UPI00317D6516